VEKMEDREAFRKEQEHECIWVQTLKRTSWMPPLGRLGYVVLSLSFTLYSVFNVLANRHGST
jgi:hypothetical protein